jgi:hypothetical protein
MRLLLSQLDDDGVFIAPESTPGEVYIPTAKNMPMVVASGRPRVRTHNFFANPNTIETERWRHKR